MAIDTPAVTNGFLDDVKASLAAWRKAPGLPIVAAGLIVTSGLTVSPHGNGAVLLALFVMGILSIGWIGTQLVWYRRAFDGAAMGIDEVIQVTLRFVPRYFLLLCLPFLLLGAVIAAIAIKSHTLSVLQSPGGRFGVLVYISIVELIGTFVVPGLAFSTRKVTQAIPIGLRMLARGWPGNWMYVVVPALVAAAFAGLYFSVPPRGGLVFNAISTLVALAFAGAIARYYLRNES